MTIAIGAIIAVALVIFFTFAGIAIRHAAQFRYLSTRTVYLSLGFAAASSTTALLLIGTYVWFIIIES